MTIDINQLLDIGISLSSEKDRESLLERILTAAMEITNCDAGTLYIKSQNALNFHLMFTKSQGLRRGGRYGAIDLPPVPLARQNVCACAALDRVLINVPDGYSKDQFDFSGPRNYDALTGYHTMSMLVVPMEDDSDNVIGVLQLINAMDDQGAAVPFDRDAETVVRSLGSQAAICLTNMNYAASIQELMNSFVRVMSTAIDARTPYNANHTRNMVRYGGRFIDWLNRRGGEWTFAPARRREFLLAVWLHDVGKLAIPLEIMDKESRLGVLYPAVRDRLRIVGLLDRNDLLEGKIDQAEYDRRAERLESVRSLVVRTNSGGILSDSQLNQLRGLGGLTYREETGALHPLLTTEELDCLTIRRGTLTSVERQIMEGHVTMTSRMLGEMRFPPEYASVPLWAGGHHEFLNGTGYPQGLSAEQLPRETRLLTILDVFEAMTALDRPYAPPKPLQKALSILDEMADEGKLDRQILSLFQESRAWEENKS